MAVSDGRILGAGTLEELTGFGQYELDEQFADNIIMPGMVEGHCHTVEGKWWRHVYCGFHDRMDPHGKVWPGLKSIDEVIARMQDSVQTEGGESQGGNANAPITGWAIDPIYYTNKTISRHDLDKISTTRPVCIVHASGHIMNVNSRALEMAELLHDGIQHDGIPLGDDGLPTGELKGPSAMFPVSQEAGFDENMLDFDEAGLIDFGRLCVRTGVTTATDLAARLTDELVEAGLRVTGSDQFPARIVALRFHHGLSPEELIQQVEQLATQSTDRFRLGAIKVIADGSIQGFSARLKWPGYFNGAPNGLWYIAPEQMKAIYEMALKRGIQVHTHTNGDEATDLVLDTMEAALRQYPSNNHRFTIQHGQMINAAQYRRMAKLNMCVNHFANHHFYWGDEHYRLTVGPERAERMNACRTALDNGIPLAIHSDAPVTPLGPLFTAWCAVNRITASGRVQGEHECISQSEAMHAITIGAAYTLGLDAEIGSIEAGKHADFAILHDDPLQCDPKAIKDITVWGTVQAGRVFAASAL